MENKMSSQRYFLGIDGGASKTEAWLVDQDLRLVAQVVGGPSNFDAMDREQALNNLELLIKDTIQSLPASAIIAAAVFGLAGVDNEREVVVTEDLLAPILQRFPVRKYLVVNDTVIALESGAGQAAAMVLITGTGSNSYGRNSQGQEVSIGGWDYLLDDEGSAYNIGMAVLRMAVQSFDVRIEKSRLEQLVCDYFQISSIVDLKTKVYHPPLAKHEIAKLAPLCDQALADGDKAAKQIFDHEIEELVKMIAAAIKRLTLEQKSFDLVWVGGVNKVIYLRQELMARIKQMNPQVNFIFPDKPPVFGAVKLAKKLAI